MRPLTPLVLTLALASGCEQARGQATGSAEPARQTPASVSSTPQTPSDCVRGQPEALLAAQSDFKPLPPNEAVEEVRTDAPVRLMIRHFGCTHYALDFEFTWPDPQMPEPRVSLGEAASLLEKLLVKDEYKPLLKTLVAAVKKMAAEPYKQPVTLSETETLTATTPAPNVLRIRYSVSL